MDMWNNESRWDGNRSGKQLMKRNRENNQPEQ